MANLPSTTNKDTGSMMFIGETCSLDDCGREDFLPFRCPDCSNSFCVSHFRPTSHQCSSHNPSSGDYFVPLCPLCHLPPKNWSRNEDPNIAMSLHLDSLSCPALDQNGRLKDDLEIQQKANSNRPNKRRIKRENECQVLKCRKIMMVPIDCKECNGKFCVEHRGVKEHRCEERKENLRNSYRNNSSKLFGIAGGSGKKALGNSTSNSNSNSKAKVNNPSSIGTDVKSKLSKLNLGGTSNSSSSSNSSPPTQSNLSASNPQSKDTKPTSKPFNFMDKSDKRAKSERASQLKALKARHAKGLLSNAEQLKLAEEMALEQKQSGKKEDCLIC